MDSEIIFIQNPLDLSKLPAFVTARQYARIIEDRSYREEIYSAGLQMYEGSGQRVPIDLRTLDTNLAEAAAHVEEPPNMMVHLATDDEDDEEDEDDEDDEDYEDYEDDENDEEDEDNESESNLDIGPAVGDNIEPDQNNFIN